LSDEVSTHVQPTKREHQQALLTQLAPSFETRPLNDSFVGPHCFSHEEEADLPASKTLSTRTENGVKIEIADMTQNLVW
jgi:hypothetical protein